MNYGLYLPNFGDETSARSLATLAREAEGAGWDGFFLWDHIVYRARPPVHMVDPWIALTAMAMTTERIRLGTTVTPVPRRRPWILARETASLDQLSGGRVILGVGLGDPPNLEFAQFGEEADNRIRAAKLDEGLDILAGLWSGQPFGYVGTQYKVKKITFQPPPLQTPRILIWVAGFWPNKAPFRRAARWDGVIPLQQGGLEPEDVATIATYIKEHRTANSPFDIVKIGSTPGNNSKKASKLVNPFAAVGVTWWLESLFTERNSLEAMRRRILQGPPKI